MENSFGLNTIPNIGKFALAKNFMGSPDRIKEMKN